MTRYGEKDNNAFYDDRGFDLAVVALSAEESTETAKICLELQRNAAVMTPLSKSADAELRGIARQNKLLYLGSGVSSLVAGGVSVGRAPRVESGGVAAIAATGDSFEEFLSALALFGGGAKLALPCGANDFYSPDNTAGAALRLCADAADVDTIVFIPESFERSVIFGLLDEAAKCEKRIAAYLKGVSRKEYQNERVTLAASISEAAATAAKAEMPKPPDVTYAFSRYAPPDAEFVRGLFNNREICDGFSRPLASTAFPLWSNVPVRPLDRIPDAELSQEHTVICFDEAAASGAASALGRPSSGRAERILREARDLQTAVVAADCAGRGAARLADVIEQAKREARRCGASPEFVIILSGSELDSFPRSRAKELLERQGAYVTASSKQAAETAVKMLERLRYFKSLRRKPTLFL